MHACHAARVPGKQGGASKKEVEEYPCIHHSQYHHHTHRIHFFFILMIPLSYEYVYYPRKRLGQPPESANWQTEGCDS